MADRYEELIETSAGRVAAWHEGRGPDLVLVHGWPWSSHVWRHVIDQLSEGFRLHWYDMPGYGQSERLPCEGTGIDVQGLVLAELLGSWALDRPVVLAHDIGGAAALRAHLLHGADMEKLVLLNVVALKPWGSAFFDHVARHHHVFRVLPPRIHEAIVRAYVSGAFIEPLADEDVEALVQPWLTAEGTESFYNQFAAADERYTDEVEPLLGVLRCPTSILWGERDPWIPIDRGRELHRLIPGSRFFPLPGLGHLPQLEDPAVTVPAIRRALSSKAQA